MLAVVAVLIGGALGTAARAGLDLWIHHSDREFPLDTLLINIVGSLVLGFLVARVWPVAPNWVRAGVGPGLLGGFTTFSAVMASMVTLAAGGQVLLALLYIVATLVLGFGAAALGLLLGRRRDAAPIVEADE
jgi:CrcB protein